MRKFALLSLLMLCITGCSAEAATASPAPRPTSTQVVTLAPGLMPCMVVKPIATPEPVLSAQFEGRAHIAGPDEAAVTIVVFSDYQCPGCAYLSIILKQLRQAHPDDLRLVYLNYPISGHDKAAVAIQAAEAADLQGKFWEMHDLLFEKLNEWSGLPPADFPAWAERQAAGLGMDAARFRADFQGPTVAERLKQAVASSSGVQKAVPILFVNSSTPYSGRVDFGGLDQVIRLLALTKRQFSSCPPVIVDPLKQYLATLHTSKGDILVQLYADKAPLAVNNFVFLARAGWYDGITFHRVLAGQLAQTGDPSATGLGNPGYLFANEFPPGLRFDGPGVVAMDNTGPGTNGSQFFLTEAATPQMNGQYTIFGQVLGGLDVLRALAARDQQPEQILPPGDELISVTIAER